MNFNKHLRLEGQHAFLGASTYHWIRYDEEKLSTRYLRQLATLKGTQLHEFAAQCIKLGQKLPRSSKTINRYVNDAIGFKMSPEVVLYYSDNCFGTADTIGFRNNFLRIHDYKSGLTPASMDQLYVYVAIFCLEYNIKPSEIDIETRIYQNDDVIIENPSADIIVPIMDKIITFDKIIEKIKSEGV